MTIVLADRLCPICSSSKRTLLHSQDFYLSQFDEQRFQQDTHICNDCGMVYVSPFLDHNSLSKLYTDYSAYEYSANNYTYPSSLKMHAKQQYEYIKKLMPETESVIDVGCSHGYLLSLFKSSGSRVYGVEPSPLLQELARKIYGIKISTEYISNEFIHDSKYSLIVLSHILEHVTDPVCFLTQIERCLDENGLIFVETPLLELFSARDPFALSFEHVNYFSAASFSNLMKRTGYACLDTHVFLNESETAPFYPTYAQVWTKTNTRIPLSNKTDYNRHLVSNYIETTESILHELKRQLDLKLELCSSYALWGAGIVSSTLIQKCQLTDDERLKLIFDSDTKKVGKTFFGLPIVSTTNISASLSERQLEAIVIASWSSEKEIYSMLCEQGLENVRILTLFN